MRHAARYTLYAALFLVLLSCSTKTQTVKSYEATGQTLAGIYNQLKPACDAGTIPADDCKVIKDSYNRARAAYIQAGNILKMDVMADGDMQRYESLTLAVTTLIQQLTIMAVEYGVIK